MPAKLLEIIDLCVSVRVKQTRLDLLKDINLSVESGKTLALVGESGSGKSMIALAIMQLLPPGIFIEPTSSIFLNGKDLLTLSELQMRQVRGRRVAIIFQEAITALNPVLTIGEQISEVIKFHFKLKRREIYARSINLLHEVGIPDPVFYYKAYPHELSGGLKQRAMIAIALAGEPELLIADEPTTALDVTLQAQIIALLKDLQQKRGMGLIFITHDLGIVYQVADTVAVLYKGEVVESASAEDFFTGNKHPYTKKLFAALPGWSAPPLRPNSDENPILLKVAGLKVYYPIKKGLLKRTVGYVKAVDDVNLEIKKGQTLALVGESGSGKTTTGMAILRLTPIFSGRVFFENQDLTQLTQRNLTHLRHDYQVVFQDPYGSMNPRMLIRDIIAEGLNVQKLSESQIEQKIDDLLSYVGIELDAKDRYPHEFSGGQRQRICIARALAVEPKLLICDEPTSALDVSAQMKILQLLLKLQQEKGLAYLLITHNIAVVEYMADEVAVMKKGQIVEKGRVDQVLYQPQNSYTQKLLQAVPQVPKNLDAPIDFGN